MSETGQAGPSIPAWISTRFSNYLPHRYPILLVDRVLEVVPGERITALKNVSMNEPFFPGHYPHHPVMPGVLVIEAMAQTAAILSFKTMGSKPDDKSVYYFVGIDNARFKRPVGPGDQLMIDVRIAATKRGIWKFSATAKVDGQVAAEADLMCAVRSTPGMSIHPTAIVHPGGAARSRRRRRPVFDGRRACRDRRGHRDRPRMW
jgi:3-hydroxyacyl-[acyl-carrier-protein] dehydratase